MGSLSSKLNNFCTDKANNDSFWCSCWKIKNVKGGDTYSNEIKCGIMVFFGVQAVVLSFIIVGAILTVLDVVPILAENFEGLISIIEGIVDTFLDVFQNFQWITDTILGAFKPLTKIVEKMVEWFFDIDQFVQQAFSNTNPRFIYLAFAEVAAMILMYTFSEIDHAMVSWKGSPGYRAYHILDTPFRYVREKLKDDKLMKLIFNLITFPIQSSLMVMCILISVVSNIF